MTSLLWNTNLENSFHRIYKEKPSAVMNIIEIGSFEGYGTLKLHELFCQHKDSRITVIDPFDDCYVKGNEEFANIDPIFVGQYPKFLKNTERIKDSLIIHKDYSGNVLSGLTKIYDFIYIDGDHSEKGVYEDGVNAFKITKSDGIILFDDYNWEHKTQVTKNGIEKFISEYQDKITVLFRGPVQCAVKVN
jgi:predicted O-methyltransferase YrrM